MVEDWQTVKDGTNPKTILVITIVAISIVTINIINYLDRTKRLALFRARKMIDRLVSGKD